MVQVCWRVWETFGSLRCHEVERVHKIQTGFLHMRKKTTNTARQQYSTSAHGVLLFSFDIWINKQKLQVWQAPILDTMWTEYLTKSWMNEDRNGLAFLEFLLKLGKLASIMFDHTEKLQCKIPRKQMRRCVRGRGEHSPIPWTRLVLELQVITLHGKPWFHQRKWVRAQEAWARAESWAPTKSA